MGFVAHHRSQIRIPGPSLVEGDPDVLHPGGLLHLTEDTQLGGGVTQVVHLDQVDGVLLTRAKDCSIWAPAAAGSRRSAAATPPRSPSWAQKTRFPDPDVVDDATGHLLVSPVAGARIEDRAPFLHSAPGARPLRAGGRPRSGPPTRRWRSSPGRSPGSAPPDEGMARVIISWVWERLQHPGISGTGRPPAVAVSLSQSRRVINRFSSRDGGRTIGGERPVWVRAPHPGKDSGGPAV